MRSRGEEVEQGFYVKDHQQILFLEVSVYISVDGTLNKIYEISPIGNKMLLNDNYFQQ